MKPTSSFLGQWKYLYRAVDSNGIALDFLLSAKRSGTFQPKGSWRLMLNAVHTQTPRVINIDKNAAYPPKFDDLKADEHLPAHHRTTLLVATRNYKHTDPKSSRS